MFGARLPLDRAPYERLVAAVLSWTDPAALTPHDFEQIALQLTGYACAVATDVRHHADLLDEDTGPRALAEIILAETQRRLDTNHQGTLRSVQSRARLVRALYERLDRLQAAPDLNHHQSPQPTAQDPGRWCGVSLCSADMSRGRSSAVDRRRIGERALVSPGIGAIHGPNTQESGRQSRAGAATALTSFGHRALWALKPIPEHETCRVDSDHDVPRSVARGFTDPFEAGLAVQPRHFRRECDFPHAGARKQQGPTPSCPPR
ncbi:MULTISPECIES: DUF6415 family natural product biosynthesis protein [unclassified Streptomyces]|uniref:DUF6415 family natural product biosynthesis protein n=1 Tax=Streptomyces sp. NPDC055082 TaxID=3365718 RepID=UPI0037CDD896